MKYAGPSIVLKRCLMLLSGLLPKRLAHPVCQSVASFAKRASRRRIAAVSMDPAAEVLQAFCRPD